MTRTIQIKGEIGWEVYASNINRQLFAAGGEDIIIEIASPGGSFFEGVEIFNAIASYKGRSKTRIVGLAASMASYIALAADIVEAADNAIFMIHNPQSFVWGDQHLMDKVSRLLDGLGGLLSQEYEAKTGKSSKEIRQMMDDETWLFGAEIEAAGFADSTYRAKEGDSSVEKDGTITAALLQVDEIKGKIRQDIMAQQYKIAAMAEYNRPVAAPENEEIIMNPKELEEKHPALYAELVALGFAKGIEKERSRVNAHLNFHAKGIACDHALAAVREGKELTDEETAFYIAEAASRKTIVALTADSPQNEAQTAAGEKPAGLAMPVAPVVAKGDDDISVEQILSYSRY